MRKIYSIVAMLLMVLMSQAATKTMTISMSKEYDDTPLGQWLIDNLKEKDDYMKNFIKGDATISPFVFHLYCDDGCGYNDSSNLFGLYGDMSITCTQGRILALEANISDYDEDEKVRASVYGTAIYNYNKDKAVGTTRVNGDDEIFTWSADNSEGYEAITIATSNNCLYFHEITITYEEYTFSTATAPVTAEVRMSKDYDDTPLGQWLIDNIMDMDEDAQYYSEGDASVPPFVFHLYCDDGCDYNDSSNLFGLYGDMSITCSAGRIIALEADISDFDEDQKVRGEVFGTPFRVSGTQAVGTTKINGDDELFTWKTDVPEGYTGLTISTSRNCLYFNTLKITYIPYGGDEEEPIEAPDAPTDAVENELVQSDFVDVMNPDQLEQNVSIEKNKNYNVYGFDFSFAGSNAKVPAFVYKTNSDDDVLGEVTLYGGDSFTVTAGKTIEKEAVRMSYAVFTLTSAAKVAADKGEVAVNGLTMTWWGDPTESVTFTVSDPAESCLAFKEATIYTDKDIFVGGLSSGGHEYNVIKDGTITKSSVNLYVESNPDFSLTVGAIAPNLGVTVQTVTIKVNGKNLLADTKKGQYSCATFAGPFTNKQEIPVELTFIYDGGATVIPFSVIYPNSISYKPNAPFTFKQNAVNVPAETSTALEVVNAQNLPLTYSISDPTVASIDANGKVTGLKAGEATVTATFAGNDTYLAGTATMIVAVGKVAAPVSLSATDLNVVATKTANAPVVNSRNLPLTYTMADTSVATVDDKGAVTGVKSGTTTMTIEFAGSDVYLPISLSANVIVAKDEAPLSVAATTLSVFTTQYETISVDNAKNLPITFTSSNTDVATVDTEGIVTGVTAGTSNVTIAFAGDDVYNAKTLTVAVTVEKSDAPIMMNTLSFTTTVDETVTIAVENAKNLPLTFTVADTNVATVDAEGVAAGVSVGETTVTVAFAGDNVYNGISFSAKISVEKGEAPISLATEDYTVDEGKTIALAINNPKNLNFTYVSGNASIATVSEDGTITGVAPGTTTITIAFAGNDNYWGTSLTANVTVKKDSGIDSINADAVDAIYFDLNGQRIYRPAKGMILIRVEGVKASKVLVK